MKVVIIDDEPKAIELINSYLQFYKEYEVVGTFRNGIKAIEYIKNEKVDLAFIDINMPHIKGTELARMISSKTAFIFTTAYSEYAVESYDIGALDYLVKPISMERFTKALLKLAPSTKLSNTNEEAILLRDGSKKHIVKPSEINYLEKDGNYMTYYTINQKIITRESIQEALTRLPLNFLQVHKSYIVNLSKITLIDKDELSIDKLKVPIGSSFQENLKRYFE